MAYGFKAYNRANNMQGQYSPADRVQAQQQYNQMNPSNRMMYMGNMAGGPALPQGAEFPQSQQGWQPLGQQPMPQQAPPPPPMPRQLANPTDRQQQRMDYLQGQGMQSQGNFANSQNPYGEMNANQQQRLEYLQSQGRDPRANFARKPKQMNRQNRPPVGILSQPPLME
jgi:hypothetical protein